MSQDQRPGRVRVVTSGSSGPVPAIDVVPTRIDTGSPQPTPAAAAQADRGGAGLAALYLVCCLVGSVLLTFALTKGILP